MGLGRTMGTSEPAEGSLATGDPGGEIVASSLMPSFQGGGEEAWNRSWPLSSARLAVICVSKCSMFSSPCNDSV